MEDWNDEYFVPTEVFALMSQHENYMKKVCVMLAYESFKLI